MRVVRLDVLHKEVPVHVTWTVQTPSHTAVRVRTCVFFLIVSPDRPCQRSASPDVSVNSSVMLVGRHSHPCALYTWSSSVNGPVRMG